jgi:hypothetical protein
MSVYAYKRPGWMKLAQQRRAGGVWLIKLLVKFGQNGEPAKGLEKPPDLIGNRFVRDSQFVTAYVVYQRGLAYNHLT